MDFFLNFFTNTGLPETLSTVLTILLAVVIVIGCAYAAYFLAKKFAMPLIVKLVSKSASLRDDVLIQNKVFERLIHFVPVLVVYLVAPTVFEPFGPVGHLVVTVSQVLMVVTGALFLDALLNAGSQIYNSYEVSKEFPVKSFVQIAKLLIYFLAFVFIVSLVLGQSPVRFLTGLGALTAVLMFVFKDPILGFVAGIQLTANKMVAVGDWIEMPKFNADGDVMEIALTTVKIQNFDKTITTVPTHMLISDSFKNWRGMSESGGRRIKRSVHIDIGSIRFCNEEMLERFSKIQYIADYIKQKHVEVSAHNEASAIDLTVDVNGRRMTNVGTFRAYVEAYLRNHPDISADFTLLVRQLRPSEYGLPIEIYVFTKTTNWLEYEAIQADIFDHILAAVKEFDLRLFQNPTGSDFARMNVRDV